VRRFGLLLDAEESERKDLARSARRGGVAVEVLAEIVSENGLAFPRYQLKLAT
jgi:hypothetical protein